MSVNAPNKVKSLLNYITGSVGGWRNQCRHIGGLDYFIESGSEDIYFNEMNTLWYVWFIRHSI